MVDASRPARRSPAVGFAYQPGTGDPVGGAGVGVVHLPVHYPPKAALAKLVNSLKG